MGTLTIQKRLARSMALKRATREAFINGTGTGTGTRRRDINALFYEIMEDIISGLSDNQCRDLCHFLMDAADLKEREKQELLQILFNG